KAPDKAACRLRTVHLGMYDRLHNAIKIFMVQQAKLTDQTQRTRDYQQAQKIVIDDAAYVYLFQKNYQLAMNKEVKGFVFNPMLEQVFNINTMSK
ncbi:hypothetical protein ACUOA9_23205, partial [Escherichia sp. HC-TM1]